jgi:hypothetical protein
MDAVEVKLENALVAVVGGTRLFASSAQD